MKGLHKSEMENKRYRPLLDKIFWIIWVPTFILLALATVITAADIIAFILMISVDLFTVYFMVSPLFGYVELREESIFVKLGFFMKKEIPYNRIRDVEKTRKLYSDSMSALKNSLDHVNIKYNRFDVLSVSVVDNDDLIKRIKARMTK